MIRKTTILAIAAWMALAMPQSWAQTYRSLGAASLSVTNSTGNVALPAGKSGDNVMVLNVGGNEAFVAFGGSTVTAATTDESVPSGSGRCFALTGAQTYIAAITASSTTTLRVSQGVGGCSLSYRGGSGSGSPTGSAGGDLSGTYPNPTVINLQTIQSLAKSADYTTQASDLGKSVDVTTGSGADVTITLLSAVTAGTGAIQYIQKVDTGTKKVIVTNGVTQQAWLSAQYDQVSLRSNGTTWAPFDWKIAVRLDSFTTAGADTWTKPPLAKTINVVAVAGGTGGGSGARESTALSESGGGGGGGAGLSYLINALASNYGSTEAIVVGAKGTGGAAQTSNDMTGNPGVLGGFSSFSTSPTILSTSQSGTAPTGGQSNAVSTAGSVGAGRQVGGAGAAGVNCKNGANYTQNCIALQVYGAGSGAGQTAITANFNGGASGASITQPSSGSPATPRIYGDVISTGGIGASKTNPVTGTGALYDLCGIRLGQSGGGGWAASDGTAGAGSDGTQPGGSGGGGGSSQNGNNSGKGGDGADGGVYVCTQFNFLLKRDLDPANDNKPMWLNEVA